MEKKKEYLRGLSIRMTLSILLFLLFLSLWQIEETNSWLHKTKIYEKIQSFEEIYRLEDECILWYNSFADGLLQNK
ncbi:MAG: hypothetical protein RSB37_07435 [Acetivibrio sp.]